MPEPDPTTCRFTTSKVEEKIKKWVDDTYRVEARRMIDQHGNFEITDKMMIWGEK